MSKLLFIRSYLIIVFLILVVGWGLDRILAHYTLQDNTQSNKTRLQGSFLYIDTLIGKHQQNIADAWEKQQVVIQSQLGYPVTLYHHTDFSNEQQIVQSLLSGQIITMDSEKGGVIYYRQVQSSVYIIALGPLHDKTEIVSTDIMLIAVYHLMIAGALFLWLWPLSRDLHELRRAAIDFGEENFTTRVKLAKTSSIDAVAVAFNSMAQRIQELVSAHQELTHAVSHELKTPLARFKFSLEILGDADDAEQRKKYLQGMKQDVSELDELIEEMLGYAKFGAHNLKLNLEDIVPEHWLKDIIKHYDEKNIKIQLNITSPILDKSKTITIDSHLMSRAINNLIRNGLRYAESQLVISLEIVENQVNLHIEDDGPGIPEQFYEQIFQPFTRLDTSRDKQSGGYGLGLAIVQKILLQHGGQINVGKSQLGGADFLLNWPCFNDNSSQ